MFRFILSIAVASALGVAPVFAAGTGTLAGHLETIDHARLPGISLDLTEPSTGRHLRVASGADGFYRLSDLTPGEWLLVASLPDGSELVRRAVTIGADRETTLVLVVELPVFASSITALGGPPDSSLEAPRLRELAARDVGEALASLPGVAKLSKGAIANDVVLRGFQSRDLNVLIDGQRVHGACPNKMDPAAFHVDFAEVERIEVAKGPVDLRHQGSLAGLVNVITRRPDPGWHLRPELGFGSRESRNPSLVVSRGAAALSFLVGASHREALADRDGNGNLVTAAANYRPGEAAGSAYAVDTGWGRVALTAGTHALDLSFTGQRADRMLYPYLAMDAVRDDADRLQLRYSRQSGDGQQPLISARAAWANVDHWMDDALRTGAVGRPRGYSMATAAETTTSGLAVEADGDGWSAGIEGYRRSWDATNWLAMTGYRPTAMIPDVTVDAGGLFVEHTRILGPALTLVAGARLDAAHSRANEARANAPLYQRYHPGAELAERDVLPAAKLRLGYRRGELGLSVGVGHTERLPEPTERYLALARMTNDWVGDPSLSPSRNNGLDLELTWERSGRRVALALYGQQVTDWIAVVPVEPAQGSGGMPRAARSWANVDATVVGGELIGTTMLGDRWFLAGSATWTRGRRDALPARGLAAAPLAETPPPSARLSLRFDDGRWFAEVEEVASRRQDRVDSALGETPTPGWAVANLRAGLRWRNFTTSLALLNLFDRTYREHLSYQRDPFRSGIPLTAPGRSAWLTLGYRF